MSLLIVFHFFTRRCIVGCDGYGRFFGFAEYFFRKLIKYFFYYEIMISFVVENKF